MAIILVQIVWIQTRPKKRQTDMDSNCLSEKVGISVIKGKTILNIVSKAHLADNKIAGKITQHVKS